MAKAINWPLAFREEILDEDNDGLRLALRLGELYFINRYWVPDEIIDVRVNHKKIRKGIIVGDLRQMPLTQLSPEDRQHLKASLRDPQALQEYLSQTYQTPVTSETLVTLITYRNLPLIPDEVEVEDDPHS
jgi:hypothetical protein